MRGWEQQADRAVASTEDQPSHAAIQTHEYLAGDDMERAVPYRSLRYNQEAGTLQKITAVRLPDGRVTGNKRGVVAAAGKRFRGQHNQGQQGLSKTTQRMVRALPRVFTKEQSEAIQRRRVTLAEMAEVLQALKRKECPGLDELLAAAYLNLGALELDGVAGGSQRCCAQAGPQWIGGAK